MRVAVEGKEEMTQPAATIKLYTATGCEPCTEVKEALEQGNYEVLGAEGDPEIELIDLATEENYSLIDEMGIDVIPVAYYETQQCKIFVDDQTKIVTFDCRTEDEQKADS